MEVAWNRRRSTRNFWSALIALTFIAFVYTCFHFGNNYYFKKSHLKDSSTSALSERLIDEKCSSVCDSKQCVLQSKSLLNRMEPVTDACENFFEFACGKYSKESPDETRTFVSQVKSDMHIISKNYLEAIKDDSETAVGKLKIAYESCISEGSSDLEAIPVLLQHLSDMGVPNWPNLESDFKFVGTSLTDVLANFLKYQEYGFFDITDRYADRMTPQFNATIVVSENLYNKKEKSLRKHLVQKILQYFNLDSAIIEDIWLELESINDAILHLKQEQQSLEEEDIVIDCVMDSENEWKTTCEMLQSFLDHADINTGISRRFVDVSGDSIYFLQNIMQVLSNFSDRSISNYLTMNLLFQHLNDLNQHFRLIFKNDPDSFDEHLRLPLEIDKWRNCVDWLNENMYATLTYVYIREMFTDPVMEEVNDLIQECIQETVEAILYQEWIKEDPKKIYAEATRNIISALKDRRQMASNETILNELYHKFQPRKNSFLHNVFEHRRFSRAERMRRVHKGAALFSILKSIMSIGASGSEGYLDMTLGILFPPLYRAGLQKSLNLPSVATIVAHEIGHHLEQSMLKSSDNGLFDQLDSVAKDHFEQTFVCIENQYSQFTFDFIGKKMKGENYLTENFGDTVAISIIDKLIEKFSTTGEGILLPGIPFSLKQMLYITFAQVWCEAQTAVDEEYNYNHDSHSIGKFRLMGMAQNSKGFADAFNCSERSFMNPATKCRYLE